MSANLDLDEKPALVRFFDNFLQERNIKWLLALGMLILPAVSRTVDHFMRGPQPTFTGSFLGLCLAGAFLPGIDWSGHPLPTACAALLLWGMFAVGTIKANRHVFWLTEAQQAPRIFGFFPMCLVDRSIRSRTVQ